MYLGSEAIIMYYGDFCRSLRVHRARRIQQAHVPVYRIGQHSIFFTMPG